MKMNKKFIFFITRLYYIYTVLFLYNFRGNNIDQIQVQIMSLEKDAEEEIAKHGDINFSLVIL